MHNSPKHIIPYLVFGLLAFSACSSGFVKSMSDVMVLQAALAREFQEQDVTVNLINSRFLAIGYINSKLNDADSASRGKRAQATALFVKERFPGIAQIDQIRVHFTRHKTRFIVVNQNVVIEFYVFDRNAQPLVDPHDRREILQPVVRFQPHTAETEISLNHVQLDGRPDEGLSLIPHFALKGDANSGKLPPPKEVGFDLASISRKYRFPGESVLQVEVDGQVALKGKGEFKGSQSPDGVNSRFLYLKIPYAQFRRITEGQEVLLRIADNNYRLTEDQLGALREMRAYVQE